MDCTKNINIPCMMTVNKTAELFGLSKHYIRSLALSNKVVHVRAGKKILINCDKLGEYLSTGETVRQEQPQYAGIKPIKL